MTSGICSFVAEVVPDDKNGELNEEEPPWIGQEVVSQELEEMRINDQLPDRRTPEVSEPGPKEPNDPGNDGDEGEDLEKEREEETLEHKQLGEGKTDNDEPTLKAHTSHDARTKDEDEDEDKEGSMMERLKSSLEAVQPVAEPEKQRQKGKLTTHPEEDKPRRTLRRSDRSQRIGLTPREPLYNPGRKASNDGELEGMTTGTGSQPIPEDACPKKEGLSFENSKSDRKSVV